LSRGRLSALWPLLFTAVSMLGGFLLVEKGRAWMIDAALHPPSDADARATLLANGVTLQMNALACAGVVVGNLLLIAALTMALPWALRQRRDQRPVFATLATAFALAGLTLLALRGMLQWSLGAIHVFASV